MVKYKNISILEIVTLVMVVTFLIFSGVTAQDTDTVTATVTVEEIALSVTDGTIDYGIIGQNSTRSTIITDLNDQQTVSNDGNINQDFNIQGQNSANWTLGATADTDQYIHRFCEGASEVSDPCEAPPTNYTALTTSYATLAENITPSGTFILNLQINTPDPSTVFTQQSVDVSIQAVASN